MSAVENCLLKKTLFEELEKSGIFNVFLDPLKKKELFLGLICVKKWKNYICTVFRNIIDFLK